MDWEYDYRGRAVFSSVRAWRTVREGQADGPHVQCSSRVLRVLARLCFRSDLVLVFVAAGLRTVHASVADGPWPARTVRPVFADGPFFSGRFWWFCLL
jgi:hypothetical protein